VTIYSSFGPNYAAPPMNCLWTHSVPTPNGVFTIGVWEGLDAAGCWVREQRHQTTGEVIKRWSSVQGASLPQYNFGAENDELMKKFNPPPFPPANAYVVGAGGGGAGGGISWQAGSTHTFSTSFTMDSNAHIARADHTHKEQDMALRHEFTFPYTGEQIAAALDAKAAPLQADIETLQALDTSALRLLYSSRDDKYASELAATRAKSLTDQVEKLKVEATPFRLAASQTFQLDLEDIAHYGLDKVESAPAKKIRRRLAKPADETAAAE